MRDHVLCGAEKCVNPRFEVRFKHQAPRNMCVEQMSLSTWSDLGLVVGVGVVVSVAGPIRRMKSPATIRWSKSSCPIWVERDRKNSGKSTLGT